MTVRADQTKVVLRVVFVVSVDVVYVQGDRFSKPLGGVTALALSRPRSKQISTYRERTYHIFKSLGVQMFPKSFASNTVYSIL